MNLGRAGGKNKMKQISVLVIDPVGLHARPATVAVNAASKFKSEVKVAYKGP